MELITITDKASWDKTLTDFPDFKGKVYYQHFYLKAYQNNNEGQATLNIIKDGDKIVAIYPFLLRKVPTKISLEPFYSIETAYGYGGVVFSENKPEYIEFFLTEHTNWCQKNSVVAEFVRFNPLHSFHSLLSNHYQIDLNRKTVSVDLHGGFKDIINQTTSARMRNYKRAQREGLEFTYSTSLSNFKKLYLTTMKRLEADKYYLFSENYFASLANQPDSVKIAEVYTQDKTCIAAAIFLQDETSLHYHLGASDSDYFQLSPNAFLFISAAAQAQQDRLAEFHLGGGLTLDPYDSLFKYKVGFSNTQNDFYIGKKIYNQKAYNKLSKTWQKLTGLEPKILLHYHIEVENENV